MAPVKTKSPIGSIAEFLYNGEAKGRGKITKISNLDVLHGTRMPKGCYGVSVIQVYGGKNAPLPHINPMDNETTTLRDAINTIVAWPKNDLKIVKDAHESQILESTATPKSPIATLDQSTPIATTDTTTPTKKVYQKKSKPVSISETIVEKTKEDKVTEKGKGKAKIDTVGDKKANQSKKRDSKGALKTTEVESAQLHMDSDDEVMDAEIDAYIEEGANAGGEFPINKDITLRQDMLSKHLAKLRVEGDTPLPWVPLCRLVKLEKAR